jgi:NADPH:quinone reductase-like Zn-dependent oxidoreductase
MMQSWKSMLALAVLSVCAAVQASHAETMKRYQLERAEQGFRLVRRTVERPQPKAGEVLVRIRAVSLNHRDLYMLQGLGHDALVPVSDGAGEVVGLGAGVSAFKVGERVATTFFERWDSGPPTQAGISSARGGDTPGVLAQFIVSRAEALVRIPDHLSFEEAATLPCAGLTAWNGLFKHGHLQAGEYVLLEGTGGVSIFGLQMAVAAGAKPVITSSSDAKLKRAKALGAIATINYRTHTEWQDEVRKATGGYGVAHVLEIGGKETLPKALAALGLGGHVALIGRVTGSASAMEVGALSEHMGSMTSIYVGSREDFRQMNVFIGKHKLKPVIDRVFSFAEAPTAFEYLDSGNHFGKVVIRL